MVHRKETPGIAVLFWQHCYRYSIHVSPSHFLPSLVLLIKKKALVRQGSDKQFPLPNYYLWVSQPLYRDRVCLEFSSNYTIKKRKEKKKLWCLTDKWINCKKDGKKQPSRCLARRHERFSGNLLKILLNNSKASMRMSNAATERAN